MRRIKILIVSRSFFPENSPRAFRTTELVMEFARQGHEVTLMTNEREYDYSFFLKSYPIDIITFGPLGFKKFNASKNKLLGDLPRKFERLLFILFNYPDIELVWRVKNALRKQNGYDLMISVAAPFPVHWGTAWARKKNHRIAATWVADCGDPYFLNTLESFKRPFYFALIEKWFSRKADFITIPFESLKSGFFEEFQSKIRVIPQGFNFETIKISKSEPRNIQPTFAYAGGVAKSGVRSPLNFIRILLRLKEDFIFHIYATTGYELILPFERESNGKIVLHRKIPREELLPQLSGMDFLVNLLIEGTESKQVPSKLIDYGLTGRPILNVDPQNPDEASVRKFLNRDYSSAFFINNMEQYNIKNVSARFLELV